MEGERVVGGLRCSEVLADLTEYVDGRLDADRRSRIEAHVGGCSNCARFGGTFGKVVASIREKLVGARPGDDDEPSALAERLMRDLDVRGASVGSPDRQAAGRGSTEDD